MASTKFFFFRLLLSLTLRIYFVMLTHSGETLPGLRPAQKQQGACHPRKTCRHARPLKNCQRSVIFARKNVSFLIGFFPFRVPVILWKKSRSAVKHELSGSFHPHGMLRFAIPSLRVPARRNTRRIRPRRSRLTCNVSVQWVKALRVPRRKRGDRPIAAIWTAHHNQSTSGDPSCACMQRHDRHLQHPRHLFCQPSCSVRFWRSPHTPIFSARSTARAQSC
ncbi:hypothetical protein SAMN04487926_14223 [Paraburkholderia steynii]|uniref:Uncharacterized protein n=1 Tax=Paraburkholderia steynii TaxID=1245441 RepID=A0A7Z7BID2_9BURK|nr:hypothetical protein SAMN04487926_14223 [Paraburkholderia steynii]